MCGCESWTVKKAEHQRIDAFELWCWRRLLRVPWTTARRSSQSIQRRSVLSVHWKYWCWSWNSNTLGHLMWGTDSFEKTLMLGKIEGARRKGTTEDEMVGWHHWLDRHGFGWTLGVGDGQGGLVCWGPWGCKESDMTEWWSWANIYFSQFWRLESPKSSHQHIKVSDKSQLPDS